MVESVPIEFTFYDSWDQWVDEMGKPSAYIDQIFAQGLSFMSEVAIRLIYDSITEPQEFYLGQGKRTQITTLT